jgi:hypothetical protein
LGWWVFLRKEGLREAILDLSALEGKKDGLRLTQAEELLNKIQAGNNGRGRVFKPHLLCLPMFCIISISTIS